MACPWDFSQIVPTPAPACQGGTSAACPWVSMRPNPTPTIAALPKTHTRNSNMLLRHRITHSRFSNLLAVTLRHLVSGCNISTWVFKRSARPRRSRPAAACLLNAPHPPHSGRRATGKAPWPGTLGHYFLVRGFFSPKENTTTLLSR